MKKNAEMVTIAIDIPTEDYNKLKALAASRKLLIEELIRERLAEHLWVPNEETLQAMQEVEDRKDLIHAKDADDLFNKLNSLS